MAPPAPSAKAVLRRRERKRKYAAQAATGATAAVNSSENRASLGEFSAAVLSTLHVLHVLFATLLYFPGLAAFLIGLNFLDRGTLFTTGTLWTFMLAAPVLYFAGLIAPFACCSGSW